MQRHSGDTFSNRFRGVSLLLLIVAGFTLFILLMRGCAGLPAYKADEIQQKRLATLATEREAQGKLLEAMKLDPAHFDATIKALTPKIAERKAEKSSIVVPGSPTQLNQAAAPASAAPDAPKP